MALVHITVKSAAKLATYTQLCEVCTEPVLCSTKMFVDFTVAEGEHKCSFQAQPRTAERLLGVQALEFHNMPQEEKASFVAAVAQSVKNTRIPLIFSPVERKLEDGKLKWELRYISRE